MILSAIRGVRGTLYRSDTGERIPFARWANIPENPHELGEFEALAVNVRGTKLWPPKIIRGRCFLFFKPRVETGNVPEADTDILLAGPAPYHPVRSRLLRLPSGNRPPPCEHPTCNRPSWGSVSEEVELPPVVTPQGKFESARLVRRRWWCEWHYQPPKLWHGKEFETIEVKARPD